MNELEVHGKGLDQPLPLSTEALDRSFAEVDDIVAEALDSGEPSLVFDYGRMLIDSAKLRGVALMRLLYKMSLSWEKFGLLDTFADRVYDEWGFSKQTVRRYVEIWRAIFENPTCPKALHSPLLEKPVNTLGRLVRPVNEDKLVEEEDWERVAYAVDDSEVASIVKELAGKSPVGRKALQIMIYQDGRVQGVKDGEMRTLAIWPHGAEDMKDPIKAQAFERFVRALGVLEI